MKNLILVNAESVSCYTFFLQDYLISRVYNDDKSESR